MLVPRAALNAFSSAPLSVLGIALKQVQGLALGVAEIHEVGRYGPTSEPCPGLSGDLSIPSLLRVHC